MAMAPFKFCWTRDSHYDEACQATFLKVDWDVLLDLSRRLSGNPTCAYQGGYHAGGRHIVRRIEIGKQDDLWLVRIPKLTGLPGREHWTSETQFTMESEIATMKYIATSTNIPVPKVFAYNIHIDGNSANAPYILMQCIKGNMLYDIGGRDVLTVQQNLQMRKSIAWIQYELANAPLPKLGCLILKPDGGTEVGPLPASFGFEGPFDSAADYFLAWCRHNRTFKNLHLLPKSAANLIQSTERFPHRLESVIKSLLPPDSLTPSYPIVHPDFEVHNFLFDDDYKIVGVIDWEFAFSAPIDVFASLTNIYVQFNTELITQGWNDEGRYYLMELQAYEENMILKLSTKFGTLLGDLGACMDLFEQGRAANFDILLDRAEALSRAMCNRQKVPFPMSTRSH